MPKRQTQHRRRAIIDRLTERGEVSVDELARVFETSEVTIRKDLAELEQNGLLLRRYGGAVPLPGEFVGEAVSVGRGKVSDRKQSLAQAAAALIQDHNRLIIDSGTTTAALLPELGNKQGLVVMTNALDIANALRELENEPTLLMTGGTWDPRSESFQGTLAEQTLRAFNFDQLFIGADGLDLVRGTTTFNELYNLSRVMADVSREVIVMAESEKLDRRIPNLELPWSEVSTLVTDTGFPDTAAEALESMGVRVIRAPDTVHNGQSRPTRPHPQAEYTE